MLCDINLILFAFKCKILQFASHTYTHHSTLIDVCAYIISKNLIFFCKYTLQWMYVVDDDK